MESSANLQCAAESDPGRVRSNNEDRVHCDPARGIYAVVDGVGGQAAGEKAADVALAMIRNRLERQTGNAAERIREAITVANNEIVRLARSNPQWKGMACVLTVALVEDQSVYIGHVGDSRLYKIRGGRIQKITHDHSPVGEREDRGEISEAEAMRHPRRNEVYRDLGSEEHTPDDPEFIESISIPFEPDSALLLCSDGLTDQVTSAEILRIVSGDGVNPAAAVRELIEAANRAGGKDNVSVALVEGPAFAYHEPAPRRGGGGFLYLLGGFLAGMLLLAALQFRFGWLNKTAPEPVTPPHRTIIAATSINDALAQARPGDTVEVPAGEYREPVRMRDGITLRSRVPLAAIVRATVAAERLHGARIIGLRIVASTDIPLDRGMLLDDADVEVSDCEISGAAVGMEIRGAAKPVIRANSIQDSLQNALVISGPATPWISHNTIVRNGRKSKKPAVAIEDPARPVLVGNTFAENGGQPVSAPAGFDSATVIKFNFFLNSPPLPRTRSSVGTGGRS